jgi:Skp family chaperone for outer membrane proteins
MKSRIVMAVSAVIFVVGIFACGMVEKAYAKELKIGYVFMAKVFDEYQKTRDSEKALQARGQIKETERKKLVDELKKLQDEQALLSDKAKAEKKVVLDNKMKVLQDYDMKARDELLKDRNDMLGGIMGDITKVIIDHAKAEGYDYILNSDPRVMLYGTERDDLTAVILAKLNKK